MSFPSLKIKKVPVFVIVLTLHVIFAITLKNYPRLLSTARSCLAIFSLTTLIRSGHLKKLNIFSKNKDSVKPKTKITQTNSYDTDSDDGGDDTRTKEAFLDETNNISDGNTNISSLEGVVVDISSFQVNGSYATYQIHVTLGKKEWDTWHRFSDFTNLRDLLSTSLQPKFETQNRGKPPMQRSISEGASSYMKNRERLNSNSSISQRNSNNTLSRMNSLLPPLPKTLKKSFTRDFLQQRRSILNQFLKTVVSNPYLFQNSHLIEFLSQGDIIPAAGSRSRVDTLKNWWNSRNQKDRQNSDPNNQKMLQVMPVEVKIEKKKVIRNWRDVRFIVHQELQNSLSDFGQQHHYKVRGLTYMDDNQKIYNGPALFTLIHADVFIVENQDRCDHILQVGKANERLRELSSGDAELKPFLFVVNIQVPGDPPISFVWYFAYDYMKIFDKKQTPAEHKKFVRLFRHFIDLPISNKKSTKSEQIDINNKKVEGENGENKTENYDFGLLPQELINYHETGILPKNDFRNERFKIIPEISDGPIVVKKAVGSKPALLGKKLTQRYFRGENYIEIDVDVASSIVASRIVSLCRGYARKISTNIGIVIQGENEKELPEVVLGVVRADHVDFDFATLLVEPSEITIDLND